MQLVLSSESEKCRFPFFPDSLSFVTLCWYLASETFCTGDQSPNIQYNKCMC